MSKMDNHLLIDDMLDSCRKIIAYTTDLTFEEFSKDDKTIDAVIRNFEIIGEAAGRLDNVFTSLYSHIPWRDLKDYRNRLIHEYFGVDIQIVWEIIEDDLGILIQNLESIQRA